MAELIDGEALKKELFRMKEEANMERNISAGKRIARLNCLDAVIATVNGLIAETLAEREKEAAEKANAEAEAFIKGEDEEAEEEPVKEVLWPKYRYTEPIVPYSNIGKDKYRCGKCRRLTGKYDTYCHRCGAKFEAMITDRRNTHWNTTKNVPVGMEEVMG